MTDVALIEARAIEKRYVGVQALKGVSLAIEPQTIHGLVGENGAGKSTLGKVIGGVVQRDGGDLLYEGRPVSYRSPREALSDGIAVIQQELTLVPEMSVAQNIFLGVETRRGGLVSDDVMRDRFKEISERAGFKLDARAPVGSLSVAEQQKVEIMRALARDARVIIMDEPTSSLGPDEADHLHSVARSLREEGMTIVYISHFLEEVIGVTDRITVFRNGELVETVESSKATIEGLVQSMLGKPMSAAFPEKHPPSPDAEVALEVRGLSRKRVFDGIDLEVRAGEILGLAGLVGSGRTEIAKAIFGADKPDSGEVRIYGEEVKEGSPPDAIKAGMAFAPEDRKSEGLLLGLSQRLNISLPHLTSLSTLGVVDQKRESRVISDLLERVGVAPRQPESQVINLSGGNQQKVLFAKWLMNEPRVLILDEPTRGVDVGAKGAIYQLIASLADEGLAVIVISSEIEEILGLAHRVMVMRGGRIERELDVETMNSDAIMHASFGIGALTEDEGA